MAPREAVDEEEGAAGLCDKKREIITLFLDIRRMNRTQSEHNCHSSRQRSPVDNCRRKDSRLGLRMELICLNCHSSSPWQAQSWDKLQQDSV